jgi:hypothetical protein
MLSSTMPKSPQERLVARIAELEEALRRTRSEDVREAILEAIADCRRRLAVLDRSTAARV